MSIRQARPFVPAFLLSALALIAWGCARPAMAADKELPAPTADLPAADAGGTRTAVFAGGCFWCTEAEFEALKGVSEVESGYAGGTAETATYGQVGAGGTGHAESIRITYDPSVITYAQLLHVFFTAIDPTTVDGQKPDYGAQYRSAVFAENDEQRLVAQAYIDQLTAANVFDQPIATKVEPLTEFYPAEDYHQGYVRKNPSDPYVEQWAYDKVQKVVTHFPDLIDPAKVAKRPE